MKVVRQSRNWTPIRKGAVYCSPACGGDCSWDEYQKCVKNGNKVAKELGRGWTASIHESLGWFWRVNNEDNSIDLSAGCGREYMAILDGRWVAHAKTPIAAITIVVNQAREEVKRLKKMLDGCPAVV